MDQRVIQDLDFMRIIDAWAQCAQTTEGEALIRRQTPFSDVSLCEEALALAEEAVGLLRLPEFPQLQGIEDIHEEVDKASKGGVLTPRELVACAHALKRAAEIQIALKDYRLRAPKLAEMFGGLPNLLHVAERIEQTFDEDLNIRDDASPILADLRSQSKYLTRRMKSLIEKYLSDPSIQAILQDNYYTIREGRYVLPVKAEDRRFMPGIIHGTSQTGSTVFIEPDAIVSENNQLKIILDQIEVEEYRILSDRSQLLGRFASEIQQICRSLWQLDVILARGRLAINMGAIKPVIGHQSESLNLIDARNPILILLGRKVVPVSLKLDPPIKGAGKCLVISGPNAGGKSVTLSTVGLVYLMCRFGLLVPVAEGSVVPWYDEILTVVGDPTSMDRAVSTFTGQIERVIQALTSKRLRRLVLLDELASGTEPKKGEALATAIVEGLVDGGAECIVATHFDALKEINTRDGRFINARMGINPANGLPNFILEIGASGESNPFEIALSLGLPAKIVERARSLIGEKEQRLEKAITEVERLQAELLREKEEVDALKKKLAAQKKKYEEEVIRIRRDSDRLVYEARKEALEKMKRLEEELAKIEKEVQDAKAKKTVAVRKVEIREKKTEVGKSMEKEAPLVENLPKEPISSEDLKPQTPVYVLPMRAEGRIVEVAQGGKKVYVQIGNMKIAAKLEDLRKPEKKAQSQTPNITKGLTDIQKKPREIKQNWVRTEHNTIDIRGMRVDEALSAVERFLDLAYRREETMVVLIHGIGTSALRTSIRKYLETSHYCARFRAGDIEEGGEGVTIVELV